MSVPSLPSFSADISPALSEIGGLSGPAMDLVAGSQSVAQSLSALASDKLFQDAVVALSKGLTKEAAVLWAAESAKLVAAKLPASELDALAGVEDWLAGGGAGAVEGLAAALQGNEMQGPGGWAALAADWAAKAAEIAPGEAPPYAKAVEGAVKLAAALTKNDWPLAEASQGLQGLDGLVAMGQGMGLEAPDISGLASGAMDAAAPIAQAAADAVPPEQALNDLLGPFVELGMQIAAGPPPAVA
jgi:hypothetical protein